jgi:curved DNA-binding protein CbpA
VPFCPRRLLGKAMAFPASASLYALLGLPHTASAAEIKRQFRTAALRTHPDKNTDPASANHFHQLRLAYDILTHDVRRGKNGMRGACTHGRRHHHRHRHPANLTFSPLSLPPPCFSSMPASIAAQMS